MPKAKKKVEAKAKVKAAKEHEADQASTLGEFTAPSNLL